MGNTKIVAGFALALTIGACATLPKAPPSHPTPAQWGALLNRTDSLANAGGHAQADSLLLSFAQLHGASRAAAEVPFWRALYKLDPRNAASTRAEGRALMDAYAASPTTAWYRAHANVLREIARQMAEGEGAASAPDAPILAGDTSVAGIVARDLMIRTQRAEIARLNAELERIKRRLAAPTP